MSETHHIRVCAVGSENDMTRLLRVLLENSGMLEDADPEEAPKTRADYEQQVHDLAHSEGGKDDGFLYETIRTGAFGTALNDTASLTIRREACGVWTACFDYESNDHFQVEDWLHLHQRCNRLLIAAQYASYSFGLEKGSVLLCGGRAMDRWDTMAEVWMWLIAKYEYGYPPEEAIERLRKLQTTLDREDFGMSIDELLESCMAVLTETAEAVSDPSALTESMRAAIEQRDFQQLLRCQVSVAESVLWQTEHNNKWLANLEAIRTAWQRSMA